MEPTANQEEQKDLFDDNQYTLVQAGMGKRFVNYVVDVIVFAFLFLIAMFIIGTSRPDILESFVRESETGSISFGIQLMVQVFYGTYMFIVEALFNGKSLGKLFTGTRAVHRDGTPLTGRDAQLRGLIRMIPLFNALSAVGMPSYPWHDRWTKTYVIDEKLSNYALRK